MTRGGFWQSVKKHQGHTNIVAFSNLVVHVTCFGTRFNYLCLDWHFLRLINFCGWTILQISIKNDESENSRLLNSRLVSIYNYTYVEKV